jgi:hypothetical protein
MKKYLTLIIFLILSFTGLISKAQYDEWTAFGSWVKSDCFYIQYRVRSYYDSKKGKTSFEIEWKNNYSRGVSFKDANFSDVRQADQFFKDRPPAGGTQSNVRLQANESRIYKSNMDQTGTGKMTYVYIYHLELEGNNRKYSACTNGQPDPACIYNAGPDCPNYKTASNSSVNQNNTFHQASPQPTTSNQTNYQTTQQQNIIKQEEQARQQQLAVQQQKVQQTAAYVDLGAQVIISSIELFKKSPKKQVNFNGDLNEFISKRLKCPAFTFEEIEVNVELSLEPNGTISKHFNTVRTDYEGPNQLLFLNEAWRVILETNNNWTITNDEYGYGGFKDINLNFTCLNKSVSINSFDNQKTISQIESEYIKYFENYSPAFKFKNTTESELTFDLNFNFFTIKIPKTGGDFNKFNIVEFNKDNLTLFNEKNYKEIRKIFYSDQPIEVVILNSFRCNYELFSKDSKSFYISNNRDYENLETGILPKNQKEIKQDEKNKNSNQFLNILKNYTATNSGKSHSKIAELLNKYRLDPNYLGSASSSYGNIQLGYRYSYEYFSKMRTMKFIFYHRDTFDRFKKIFETNNSNIIVDENNLKVLFISKVK